MASTKNSQNPYKFETLEQLKFVQDTYFSTHTNTASSYNQKMEIIHLLDGMLMVLMLINLLLVNMIMFSILIILFVLIIVVFFWWGIRFVFSTVFVAVFIGIVSLIANITAIRQIFVRLPTVDRKSKN